MLFLFLFLVVFTFQPISKQLLNIQGWAGEGKCKKEVWIKSSSHPLTNFSEFTAQKAIILIREPISTLEDLFDDVEKVDQVDFMTKMKKAPALALAKSMKLFLQFWKNSQIKKHYVKFEDLIYSPEETICGIFCFLFNCSSIAGTLIENKVISFVKLDLTFPKIVDIYTKEVGKRSRLENHEKQGVFDVLKDYYKFFGYFFDQEKAVQPQPPPQFNYSAAAEKRNSLTSKISELVPDFNIGDGFNGANKQPKQEEAFFYELVLKQISASTLSGNASLMSKLLAESETSGGTRKAQISEEKGEKGSGEGRVFEYQKKNYVEIFYLSTRDSENSLFNYTINKKSTREDNGKKEENK